MVDHACWYLGEGNPVISVHFHPFAQRSVLALAVLVAIAGSAHAGTTLIPTGALQLDGSLANSTVEVSGTGRLGGEGVVGGEVTLGAGGIIAPGRVGAVGELGADALTWQGGGAIAFQLGADDIDSDRIALSGALTHQGAGTFEFRFDDGAAPPTAGTTYTLVTYASQAGFSAADFIYSYSGSAPALIGEFRLDPDALRFVVISTPVELQSFSVD